MLPATTTSGTNQSNYGNLDHSYNSEDAGSNPVGNTALLANSEMSQRLQQQHQDNDGRLGFLRWFVVAILLATLIFVLVDTFGARRIQASVLDFLGWVEQHPGLGVLAVILVYIIATILFVPGSILTFGTGYAFGTAFDNKLQGILLAVSAVFIGASLGSICTFLLGRYLFRDCVMRLAATYPTFQAIDRALQHNGLKIMILLRLSPLVPYNALDYMSGITAIPLWAYSLALVALLPGTIMLCFVGASASSLTDMTDTRNRTLDILTIVSGLFFAGCGVYAAAHYSKIELERILAEQNPDEEYATSPVLNETLTNYHDTEAEGQSPTIT